MLLCYYVFIQNVTMSLFRMLLCYYVFKYHPECYYVFNKSGLLPLHTVFEGRATEMFLNVFAKETGIGKAQFGTNLLDAQVGVAQEISDIGHRVLAYPVVGRLI